VRVLKLRNYCHSIRHTNNSREKKKRDERHTNTKHKTNEQPDLMLEAKWVLDPHQGFTLILLLLPLSSFFLPLLLLLSISAGDTSQTCVTYNTSIITSKRG
jgi:hypothetical protein